MPLYTYSCKCGVEGDKLRSFDERDDLLTCPECHFPMARDLCAPQVRTFKAGWYPNLGPKPVYIESMQQLRDESKARGITSHYEADNVVWSTSTRRWI